MLFYPNAKINIGLNVVEKRPDGYHNIQTVFYPIALHDEMRVQLADKHSVEDCSIELLNSNIEIPSADNLIVKAYRLLAQDYDLGKVQVQLTKNIPLGGGLGGGSANAAYMLKALNQLFNLQITADKLEKYAIRLGADCPFFIKNKAVYATGVGDVFTSVNVSLSGYYLVLVIPNLHIATAEAYAAIRPQYPAKSLIESVQAPIEYWKEFIKNDFEIYAFNKYPELAAIKENLYDLGASYAAMTGSGSTVFGLFKTSVPDLKTFEHYQVIVESF